MTWIQTLKRMLATWMPGIFGSRILIVHPEGNVFNNPNLYDIANLLGERFKVDVLVPLRKINEGCAFSSENVQLIEYLPIFGDFRFMRSKAVLDEFWAKYIAAKYRLVIGIDRDGLILASLLARRLGAPYGMISYEIFFEDETSSAFKRPERDASADLSFVVVPDEGRGKLLVKENQIGGETDVRYIPVAPACSYPYQKRKDLCELLGIPDSKKILLYAGSVTPWTGIEDLLTHPNALPDDWVLVLHDRFGDTQSKIRSFDAPALQDQVYVADITIPTNQEMHKLLHAADLGLSLYKPDFSSRWVGKNLAAIGMSSGKTNVYLQHGLPVVTSHNEVMTPLIETHGLGYTVAGVDDLFTVLQQHEPNLEQNRRCVKFFEEHLSLNVYKTQLMKVVRKSMKRGERQPHLNEEMMLGSVRESFADQLEGAQWTFEELSSCIKKLQESGERFVVYGEDTLGLTIQFLMPENVVAFVDYKSDRVSTDVVAGEIYSPQNLPNMSYDRIIVGIIGQQAQAENHLVSDLGVPKEKVVRCLS